MHVLVVVIAIYVSSLVESLVVGEGFLDLAESDILVVINDDVLLLVVLGVGVLVVALFAEVEGLVCLLLVVVTIEPTLHFVQFLQQLFVLAGHLQVVASHVLAVLVGLSNPSGRDVEVGESVAGYSAGAVLIVGLHGRLVGHCLVEGDVILLALFLDHVLLELGEVEIVNRLAYLQLALSVLVLLEELLLAVHGSH